MAVTAAQIQSLLILEVGETDAGVLAANIATLWSRYADKATIYPRLQELYTKRACIDLALGEVRQQVGYTVDGLTEHLEQKSANLAAARKAVEAEIMAVEARARAARPVAIGTLTTVEPIAPPTSFPIPLTSPDADDSRYLGDPYKPTWRPR